MKKIGLIGGMSWESSLVYYKIINEKTRDILGGFHSSRCILESVDFAEIEDLQHKSDWEALTKIMIQCARKLENAGADMIVICTNTMHLCSEEIVKNTNIPFLHIASATGKKIKEQKIKKVLLLGTKFTMEKDFFRNLLRTDFDVETIIPDKKSRETVHQIIYEELVHGEINPGSKQAFQDIINNGINHGAEGVILGCTEIPLLIQSSDVNVPVFDTTRIHAESAVEFALGK
ncbi:aspartate/glutamate racemase family protein [Sinomicrobium weinanense]|uniref:Aspartate/glutamate racemase family protein n=1 Tax=Sinomicrobium weinanense TaxID=2842200 RepID=A0A926JW36_9FLAO|nr:aspartate/glutamate racemase family protein [Sinomicrobium weinanense]MBC9798658.1 aspartate/glutamate racemase family protein [Sinomicrobium weinanense]MBU3126027.1 aspartate/glutamate racemase family protein [Sinomicrobium weinanense]